MAQIKNILLLKKDGMKSGNLGIYFSDLGGGVEDQLVSIFVCHIFIPNVSRLPQTCAARLLVEQICVCLACA